MTEELEIIQDNLKKLRDSRGRKITYLKELNRHPEIYKPFLIIVSIILNYTQFDQRGSYTKLLRRS